MGSIEPETATYPRDSQNPLHIFEKEGHRINGLNADPTYPNLFGQQGLTRKDLTPRLGTELGGFQIKDLTDVQVEELAHFVSRRGCVVFRDQTWTEHEQAAFGARMGETEKHAKAEEGKPEAMTYLIANEKSGGVGGEEFHTDICHEAFPSTYTILHCDICPPNGGGDTAFANMYAAYDKLSPMMKEMLGGKMAVNRRPLYA